MKKAARKRKPVRRAHKRVPLPPNWPSYNTKTIYDTATSYFNIGIKQDDTPRTHMVSRNVLRRAGHRLGRALPLAYLVVMAGAAWMLYRVSVKQEMILFLLNGGCLP